ncbi:hypothetical protein ACTWPB_04030 [Nocardia sp. IBHARD005]|uniref:hypothetical protein n=1 Tax=Nocardia sp. IBHARD005 TaxID=3457765 RepID=UPI004059D13D
MAIYLVVRLAYETEDEVTYQFGGADHRFDRAVTIRKADYSVTVVDGRQDAMAVGAAGLAMRRHRIDGVWAKSEIRQS